jgi:hypothetical protein
LALEHQEHDSLQRECFLLLTHPPSSLVIVIKHGPRTTKTGKPQMAPVLPRPHHCRDRFIHNMCSSPRTRAPDRRWARSGSGRSASGATGGQKSVKTDNLTALRVEPRLSLSRKSTIVQSQFSLGYSIQSCMKQDVYIHSTPIRSHVGSTVQ